jgi:hypothetical protein
MSDAMCTCVPDISDDLTVRGLVKDPNCPRHGDDQLVEDVAGMLVRIEINYHREGSGPGSRFEDQRLEIVQARAVIRHIREEYS